VHKKIDDYFELFFVNFTLHCARWLTGGFYLHLFAKTDCKSTPKPISYLNARQKMTTALDAARFVNNVAMSSVGKNGVGNKTRK